jgi:hypothetical protein
MERLSDLRFLFRVVVGLEALYALVAVLTPPSQVENVTGWVLTADGQWLTKLLGLALASQAWVAWTLRNEPHLGVAKGLAFYQLASATADWVMWIWLEDDGIFPTARSSSSSRSSPTTCSDCCSCAPSGAPAPPARARPSRPPRLPDGADSGMNFVADELLALESR